MGPDLLEAPEPIRALVSMLEAEGFIVVAERGDGIVNRFLQMSLGACGVQITADRGQWWIELGGPALGDWFDPDVWEACLDDVPVRMEPSQLEDRVEFVRIRWRAIANRLQTPRKIAGCLAHTRSTRARALLGLPPPRGNGEAGRPPEW